MGGRGRGRPRDPVWPARLRLARRLKTQGLTLREIGARLGCSRQAVWVLLNDYGRDPPPVVAVRCCYCGVEIVRNNNRLRTNGPVSCLPCLARRRPEQFGERLKAFRLAAGLSQRQLARRAGITIDTIQALEGESQRPMWATLLKLVGALGSGLVTLDIRHRTPHGA